MVLMITLSLMIITVLPFSIGKNIDVFSSNFHILLLNVKPAEQPMKYFCLIYNCKSIITDESCYKNLENPKTIDLIMINMSKSIQNS